jgi:hypothetical protein
MATLNKRPRAVFPLRSLGRIGEYMLKVRSIVLEIGNNPGFFPTPSPTLASVTTHVDDLEAAESIALTRVTGSAAARDLQYDIVQKDVLGLLSYVQTLADNAVDEVTAIAIINSSGFNLKNRGVHVKPDLKAMNGSVPGVVKLIAKAAGRMRASYLWQSSPDDTNWTDLPATLQAKTIVHGLTPGQRVFFRYRIVIKTGPQSWSNSVSWIVQ